MCLPHGFISLPYTTSYGLFVSKLQLGACSIRACSISKLRKWIDCYMCNSPAAVFFSQTPSRPSCFQSSTIALDTGLLLKAKMPIRDLTAELESRSNMDPSDILSVTK